MQGNLCSASADELIRKYEILEQEEDIWYSRKSRNKDAQ